MSHAIDIKDVIRKSTSEVPLEQLQQKGFTKVKVLDRTAIKRMIAEAVNKVVEDRQTGLSEAERQRLRSEAKDEFDSRMREFRFEETKQRSELKDEVETREARVEKLREEVLRDREVLETREQQVRMRMSDFEAREERLASLAAKADAAESQLREAEWKLGKLEELQAALEEQADALRQREIRVELREEAAAETAAGPSPEMISEVVIKALQEAREKERGEAKTEDMASLKETLDKIAATVARGGGGGGGGSDIGAATDAASIEALVRRAGQSSTDAENNLGTIEVKESKAKGVNATLDKLKNLKKSGS